MKENINPTLLMLASRLNLTSPNQEPEEYILTKEEEEKVLFFAITALKKHRAYQLAQVFKTPAEIELKISEINWEERIDKEEIFSRANSAKHYEIWQKEQRKKDAEESQKKYFELRERCNAKYFFNLMAWTSKNEYGKQLIVNDDTSYLIKVLCFYFGADSRFETELGFNFKKGLLIRGISGLGKSHLVNCIRNNDLIPINIFSMLEITDEIDRCGEFEIITDKFIYLDDAGTEEPVVNHFGTKISFFKNFIELYYSKNKPFNKLIVSTNNSFDDIEKKYGFRVRSRMKDMFNIIDVKGNDLRG